MGEKLSSENIRFLHKILNNAGLSAEGARKIFMFVKNVKMSLLTMYDKHGLPLFDVHISTETYGTVPYARTERYSHRFSFAAIPGICKHILTKTIFCVCVLLAEGARKFWVSFL